VKTNHHNESEHAEKAALVKGWLPMVCLSIACNGEKSTTRVAAALAAFAAEHGKH
jgi:hypothetical protein